MTYASKLVYQQVGTAGTPPTDLAAIGAARAKLNQQLAPKDGNRFVQMESVTMGGLVNGLKGLFQDSNQIKEQYREGMIGRTGMADWYENERMYAHTNGSSDNIGTVNDTVVVVWFSTKDSITKHSDSRISFDLILIQFVTDNCANTHIGNDHGLFESLIPTLILGLATIGDQPLNPQSEGTCHILFDKGAMVSLILYNELYFTDSSVNIINIAWLADSYEDEDGIVFKKF